MAPKKKKKKMGRPIEFHDAFHVEQRRRVRESRERKKKRRKRAAALIVLFLALQIVFMTNVINIPKAEAATTWWDSDWRYRSQITIAASTVGALTNYPVRFDLFVASGTNAGNDIYTDGTAQLDYDDFRFVANDQLTEYSYWMVDNSSWAYPDAAVWVNVTSIAASPSVTTIWAYWGNDDVASTSNGANVFPFFDDFLTDPAGNPDWSVVEGGTAPSEILHEDWRISIIEAADNGGWAYLKGAEDLVLSGASSVYGWSMEWDGTVYHSGGNEAFCYYGAALADDLTHVVLDMDNVTSGMDWYWRSANPIANRYFTYDESDAADNVVQSNGTVTPWDYGTNPAAPVDWTRYQIALFNETSYVSRNDTVYRTMSGLSSDYLAQGLDPSFSAHGKAGDGAIIRGYVNWVFFRPLANPEPAASAGETEGVIVNAGIHNLEDDFVHTGAERWLYYVNITTLSESGTDLSAGIGFYDELGTFYSMYYDGTANTVSTQGAGDGMFVNIRDIEFGSTYVYINFSVVFDVAMYDTLDIDLYTRWETPIKGDSGWFLYTEEYFSLYDLGGFTTMTSSGSAGRVAGGDLFELYANNGSSVRAEQLWRHFQHYHALVYVNLEGASGANIENDGHIYFGVDYYNEGAWRTGWYCNITIIEFAVNDNENATIVYQVDWYERDNYIDSDVLVALWEGGALDTGEKNVFGIFVDLWFNQVNASSVVGGRINSEFYGLDKTFPWWDPFHLGGDFGYVTANQTQSMAFEDLEDTSNDIFSSAELTYMKIWVNITNNDTQGSYLRLQDFDLAEPLVNVAVMTGVATPILVRTSFYEVAQGGFLAPLYSAITALGTAIYEAVGSRLVASAHVFINLIDGLLVLVGAPEGSFTLMLDSLNDFFGWFVLSIQNVVNLVTPVFTLLTSVAVFFIDIISRFITTVLQVASIVVAILNGTHSVATGLGDIWVLISIDTWIEAIPLLALISWFVSLDTRARRGRRYGMSWMSVFYSDLQSIMNVTSFILDMFFRLFMFSLDMLYRLYDMIPVI